jgi:hypothetical protein
MVVNRRNSKNSTQVVVLLSDITVGTAVLRKPHTPREVTEC